jgi:uncharacterized membrane protein
MAHPQITIQKTRLDRYLELLTLTLALGSLFYAIYYWSELPPEVPVHFNIEGEPDRTGAAWVLFIIPALNVLLAIFLLLAYRYPHKFNYPVKVTEENAAQLYRTSTNMFRLLALLISLLLTYITLGAIKTALSQTNGLNPYIMGSIVLAIVIILIRYWTKLKKQA